MSTLFRQEALEARRQEWLGTILVATPLSRWAWTLLAISFATALILFLVFGHYTRREAVTGQLVPSEGLLNLHATAAGLVNRVWVRDGQTVKQGDPLIEISGEQDSAKLGSTHALVGQQLEVQRLRLQADLQTKAQLTAQQADALRDKSALLRAQLEQIAGQLAIQKEQADSAQQLLERIRPLGSKGYVSALQLQQQQTTAYNAQTQHKTLLRQQLEIRQELDATQQQLTQLPLDAATKRNDIERQLAEISGSAAQNEAQRAVVIRAPRDGIVSTVLFKEGQMVAAGQSTLSLLPAGSTLQAQLLVPSRAVGFIEPGNQVVLRYAAFPYQKFGQHYGKVADISRSALSASEVQALVEQQPKEPLYRVQVTLDSQHILAYGKPEPVKPGMTVDADILMERRTLLEWVFEPLYGMAHHLLGGAHG
ncbi:HlyD family efflux transporter periplasmic adaptor subunit [Dyella sp.]|uniref:HlyD family efflux transporter periplasmic adaptor subunit n=1 Tax=Dyella sp. TaxID=1869338 RepID=UPI002D76EE79|nr:HlyD family efflux transporter periplasmic adaptor subunit [Dyella sp.]HET7331680.1 HlyD family efflux transporter periplasmic adaptor subunit [Dyella sp.]